MRLHIKQRLMHERLPAMEKGVRRQLGFSLAEVVISLAIAGVIIAGVVSGYIQSARTAERAAYSLAANAMAIQSLEMVKAAKWDPNAYPPLDNIVSANFPARIDVLDIPMTKSNVVYATNFTTISVIATSPPLKMIRVDTVWTFYDRGVVTSTVSTYRAPDQ